MSRYLPLALLLLSCFSGISVRAQQPSVPASSQSATVQVLSNGARLIVLPEEKSDIVSLNVFFNVGRADERNTPGINALLCRTWGDASEFRTAALLQGDIARTGSIGTEYNEDWVELWGISGNRPSDIRKSFQTVLVNLVANPLFTSESLAAARESQERAAALERDNLITTALDALRSRAFAGSVYGISALGVPERLATVRPETLRAYYNRYFRPNRCTVVVCGKVESEAMRRLVEASFGAADWNSAPPAPPISMIPVTPIPVGLRDLTLERTAPATLLSIGWLAPGTASFGDEAENRRSYATLLLLDSILGGGKASRLFHQLRDVKPVGYDIRTTLLAGRGGSLWCVYVTGGVDREVCRAAVNEVIVGIANGTIAVTESELARARAYCKTHHLEDTERNRDRAFYAGWSEVMGLGAVFASDFDSQLDAITLADIQRMARTVFNSNAAAVYASSPIKSE